MVGAPPPDWLLRCVPLIIFKLCLFNQIFKNGTSPNAFHLLHNESTFIPLMFALPFDLTISVQILQFSVTSGLKELITLLGA